MDQGKVFMKIGQVGLGYVGLVNAAVLANHGNTVVGIDTDKKRIEELSNRHIPIYEPMLKEYLMTGEKNLLFSDNYAQLVGCDIIFITVPTPNKNGKIDLSYVFNSCKKISEISHSSILVIKSTVLPGTANKIHSRTAMNVISNPEFTREGSAIHDTEKPDRIVIGGQHPELVEKVWNFTGSEVVCTTNENAEMIKYASNSFLATKISFINQLADLCERVPNTDVNTVAYGMGLDRRIGKDFLKAGLGYGGSCFPKDTLAFIAFAESKKVDLSLIKEASEYNKKRVPSLVSKIIKKAGDLKDKRICVLGASFKDHTDDLRESKALDLINEIRNLGSIVNVYDPVVKQIEGRKNCNSAEECIQNSDIVITATEWNVFSNIEPNLLKSKLVFDLRRILDHNKYNVTMSVGLGKN
ncbi:MAG: UDP-glucose/GDP-mannose dehydrogenase family protein [Thermoplasmatales archaeon]